MDQSSMESLKARNRRTALVLVSIAAVFFFGIVLKYWLIR